MTVLGYKAAHRINTGKRNVSHLKWKQSKPALGYGLQIENAGWKELITDQQGGGGNFGGGGGLQRSHNVLPMPGLNI